MGLREDVERVAEFAAPFAAPGESLTGVLATEPSPGRRVYLCAFADETGRRTWLALERRIGAPPRLATPTYLDSVGLATRRLEQALGEDGGSPFAAAMKQGLVAVDELAAEVEGRYKLDLE